MGGEIVVVLRAKKKQHYFKTQGSVISKEMAFIRPELSGVVHTLNVLHQHHQDQDPC